MASEVFPGHSVSQASIIVSCASTCRDGRQPFLSIPMVNLIFGFKCCTKYLKVCFPCGHTATNTGFCKETEALALATSLSVHDETRFYPKYHN